MIQDFSSILKKHLTKGTFKDEKTLDKCVEALCKKSSNYKNTSSKNYREGYKKGLKQGLKTKYKIAEISENKSKK